MTDTDHRTLYPGQRPQDRLDQVPLHVQQLAQAVARHATDQDDQDRLDQAGQLDVEDDGREPAGPDPADPHLEPSHDDPDQGEQLRDPLENLTVAEVQIGSRRIKADLITAITEDTEEKTAAMATVLWLHARRSRPTVKLEDYLGMTMGQLYADTDQLTRGETPTPPGS